MQQSVRDGLRYSLGEGGFQVMSRSFDLNAASANPGNLHAILASIFTDGAPVIERQILRQLYENVGERFVEATGYTFGTYVDAAREEYESRGGGA